jgi:hypothetical protein
MVLGLKTRWTVGETSFIVGEPYDSQLFGLSYWFERTKDNLRRGVWRFFLQCPLLLFEACILSKLKEI